MLSLPFKLLRLHGKFAHRRYAKLDSFVSRARQGCVNSKKSFRRDISESESDVAIFSAYALQKQHDNFNTCFHTIEFAKINLH